MEELTFTRRLTRLLVDNVNRFTSVYSYKQIIKWAGVKNKYKGKRVFLIANGPSLNITPLYLLKDEYTIVFNRFNLMLERLNYHPTFYMLADGLVGKDIKDDIVYFIEHSEKTFIPDISKGERVNFRKMLPQNEKVMYMFEEPVYFSKMLPFVQSGNSVIFNAFQVLRYLGFSEIIVVGNDMNHVLHDTVKVMNEENFKGSIKQDVKSQYDDDPNHFDPRYFGKGRVYHQPNKYEIQKIFDNLDVVAKEYKKSGTKVTNAGYNSRVECFPKQDFYECLGYSQDKIDSLFLDLIKSLGFDCIESFIAKAIRKDEEWEECLELVAVPSNSATTIIKKKVIEYLPIGPYKDFVYMINRKYLNE